MICGLLRGCNLNLKRRDFLTLAAGTVTSGPLARRVQAAEPTTQTSKASRVGALLSLPTAKEVLEKVLKE
jgi:hypothetical protein